MPLLALFDISVDVPLVVLLAVSMPLFEIAFTMTKINVCHSLFYATIGTICKNVNIQLVVLLVVSMPLFVIAVALPTLALFATAFLCHLWHYLTYLLLCH